MLSSSLDQVLRHRGQAQGGFSQGRQNLKRESECERTPVELVDQHLGRNSDAVAFKPACEFAVSQVFVFSQIEQHIPCLSLEEMTLVVQMNKSKMICTC